MRSDVRPLCEKDHSPMVARQVQIDIELPKYGGTKTVFLCLRERCRRRYDIIQGYHRIRARQIERDAEARRCPEHQIALFLHDFATHAGASVWMCPQLYCEYSESTTGEVGAAGSQSPIGP